MRRMLGWGMLLLLVTVTAGACASMRESKPAELPSLYKRLGGREGISTVVNDFVANMAADPRVNERFKDKKPAELEQFKSRLADQICEASGGPCSYYGKDMKAAHQGMRISDEEWNATVENLVKALDKNNVDARSKQELLATLGPMKKDIVGQ
ncbi:MAG TPA: group 1 truncated hemoglobin [Methylomirabilota bacterium]|nr:group 1 truncated hemoglobin [Methylomirabilota bacterium]